jgi:hypothetical protein
MNRRILKPSKDLYRLRWIACLGAVNWDGRGPAATPVSVLMDTWRPIGNAFKREDRPMRRGDKPGIGQPAMVTAQEIACFDYCPEQWRLQYGLGLEPENRAALDAGNRHHARKALAERVAGGSLGLGKIPVLAGLLLLGLLWLIWR